MLSPPSKVASVSPIRRTQCGTAGLYGHDQRCDAEVLSTWCIKQWSFLFFLLEMQCGAGVMSIATLHSHAHPLRGSQRSFSTPAMVLSPGAARAVTQWLRMNGALDGENTSSALGLSVESGRGGACRSNPQFRLAQKPLLSCLTGTTM